jgi:hypothetical protein
MKEQEAVKLEFLMTVNNNFIIQRFFNVRDFNPDAKNSDELYECLKDFAKDFGRELKIRTVSYMIDNRFEIISNPDVLETSFTDGPEFFNIVLKQNDMTICHRQMNAKLYPPKIRYTVDVRPMIKTLLYDLTDIFSSEDLTYDNSEVTL